MTAVAKLRHHRELGTRILIEFIEATPEIAAEIVERSLVWMRDLIPLVEPFGDGVAARFEPLTPMRPEEQATVAHCAPLDDWPNMVRVYHAVCMYRLDELFRQFGPVLPKFNEAKLAKKTGRRPGHGALDDGAAVAEIVRLVATGMTAWSAKDKAEPLAARGISTEQNAKRIYKKYKKLHP